MSRDVSGAVDRAVEEDINRRGLLVLLAWLVRLVGAYLSLGELS